MFLTLKEYLIGARKLLALYGYNCHKQDEDAIAFVAHYMMRADQTWDGTKSSRNTWRFNQAKFAIMKLKTKRRKEQKHKHVSLNTPINSNGTKTVYLCDVLEDNDKTEVYREATEIMTQAKNYLSEKQYNCVELYYIQNMTLQQIGDKFGWTREYIRQILKKAINKLRNECGVKTDSFAR